MRIRQKVDLMVFHSACKASLSEAARDEESMIVIPGSLLFLSILWVKRGRSKKCQSSKNSQNSLAYWSLEAAWIGWMTEVVKILMIGIAGMDVRKNREMTSYRGSVIGDCKYSFMNKQGTNREVKNSWNGGADFLLRL